MNDPRAALTEIMNIVDRCNPAGRTCSVAQMTQALLDVRELAHQTVAVPVEDISVCPLCEGVGFVPDIQPPLSANIATDQLRSLCDLQKEEIARMSLRLESLQARLDRKTVVESDVAVADEQIKILMDCEAVHAKFKDFGSAICCDRIKGRIGPRNYEVQPTERNKPKDNELDPFKVFKEGEAAFFQIVDDGADCLHVSDTIALSAVLLLFKRSLLREGIIEKIPACGVQAPEIGRPCELPKGHNNPHTAGQWQWIVPLASLPASLLENLVADAKPHVPVLVASEPPQCDRCYDRKYIYNEESTCEEEWTLPCPQCYVPSALEIIERDFSRFLGIVIAKVRPNNLNPFDTEVSVAELSDEHLEYHVEMNYDKQREVVRIHWRFGT